MGVLLEIKDLHAECGGEEILRGVNLRVGRGRVIAIMGPNGSGKSTLASVVAGHPRYRVTCGEVLLEGKNLLDLTPEARACEGVFLSMQNPTEIPGVSMANFLRAAINSQRKYRGLGSLGAVEFLRLLESRQGIIDVSGFRGVLNEGFSGGEKKRVEIYQMAVLSPRLKILDETDSGLDVDSLREVAEGIKKLQSSESSTILITHYQRLLEYIEPDEIHVLYKGKIVRTGDKTLGEEIEKNGYSFLER